MSTEKYLMKIHQRPAELDGQYLKSFDHDGSGGVGYGEGTFDPNEALQFDTQMDALEFWRKPSSVRPLRPDGEPNRPLTASTVEFVPLSRALEESSEKGVASR